MNWEMLSAIGQVVAAVGVIPSLIYLAIQIREQNKERRRAGINILTAQWSRVGQIRAGKPRVCPAFSEGYALL